MLKYINKFLKMIENKIDDRKLFINIDNKMSLFRTFLLFVFLFILICLLWLIR